MILSIHQPSYLPWMGYFHKIINSDVFVILDMVQYEKNSFDNRNRIRTKDGWIWLTVPVKTKGRFNENLWPSIQIDNTSSWLPKHLNALQMSYGRADYYTTYIPFFKKLYSKPWTHLLELNMEIIRFFLDALGVKDTKVLKASELKSSGKKSELIMNICQELKADTYFSGSLGRNYLDEQAFQKSKIDIVYQEFVCHPYEQMFDGFEPNMSMIDMIFMFGARSLDMIEQNQKNLKQISKR